MRAILKETDGGFECVDEYGDSWYVIADDCQGNAMIERDAGDRWDARQFSVDRGLPFSDGSAGDIDDYSCQEGTKFGINCQDEYIVTRMDNAGSLRWSENDPILAD